MLMLDGPRQLRTGGLKLRLVIAVWLLVVASCQAWAADPRPYIRDAFDRAEFIPHVYDELAIVRRYGEGRAVRVDGAIRRHYFDPASSLYVTMSGDTDVSDAYRTVDEILVSSLGSSPVATPGIEPLTGIALVGVRIGDAQAKVEKMAGSRPGLESVPVILAGKPVQRITFLAPGEDLVYYRFYCRQGRVAAMAIGVTE